MRETCSSTALGVGDYEFLDPTVEYFVGGSWEREFLGVGDYETV